MLLSAAPKLVCSTGISERFFQLLRAGAVDFIDYRHVACCQLLNTGARRRVQLGEAHRVNQAYTALVFDVREASGLMEQFTYAGRVGQPGGFDQNHIGADIGGFPERFLKLVNPAGTEHRAAGNLLQERVQLRQQHAVNALLAKFIDNQLDFLPGKQPDEVFQKGGFARAEKTRGQIQLAHALLVAGSNGFLNRGFQLSLCGDNGTVF